MTTQQPGGANDSIALRAFAVLETIVAGAGAMSLDEITQAMSLPKPTVFRIVNMLHTAGLLWRDPASKRYMVGPRLTTFAVGLWRNATLRRQWRRALEVAVAEIDESCNLTLLEDNAVLYLDRVETSRPLRLHLESGTRLPLHCTASGKLFLSQMSPEQARKLLGEEPYKAYTKATITSFARLEPELAKVRKTLVGTHDRELFEDSVSIAVPVMDHRGVVFAAVAVHAPVSRVNLKNCMQFLPALRHAAQQISSTMTAVPDPSLAGTVPRMGARSQGSSCGEETAAGGDGERHRKGHRKGTALMSGRSRGD